MSIRNNDENGIVTWLNVYSFGNPNLYKDFPEIIAQKASSLTYGNGLIFNGNGKENGKKAQDKLTKWFNDNLILEKLRKSEYVASKYGKTILFLNATNNGKDIILSYANNPFQARISKINDIEQSAEIWFNPGNNDNPQYQKITMTNDEIKVEKFTQDKTTRSSGTTGDTEPVLVKDETSEPIVIKNSYGFLPIVEVENLPFVFLHQSTYLNFRPDWLPVAKMITGYNEAYRIKQVELVANRTRYFGSLTTKKMREVEKRMKDGMDLLGDAWINQSFAQEYGSGTTDQGLTIVQGDPKLTEYTNHLNATDELIMNGSGYSSQKMGSNTEYENKTASLLVNKLDQETTQYKQSLRKDKLYRIFDYVLTFYGINPIDEQGNRIYSFNFINLSITDVTVEIDQSEKLLNMGVISTAEARAKLLNETLDKATESVKEIEKQMDIKMKKEAKLKADTKPAIDVKKDAPL